MSKDPCLLIRCENVEVEEKKQALKRHVVFETPGICQFDRLKLTNRDIFTTEQELNSVNVIPSEITILRHSQLTHIFFRLMVENVEYEWRRITRRLWCSAQLVRYLNPIAIDTLRKESIELLTLAAHGASDSSPVEI
jgi:hypothetical protein